MGLLFSLIAIFCESSGKTLDKINFRRNKITYRQSLLLAFLFMSLFLVLFVLVAHQPLPHFTITACILLAIIALFSFGGNVFDEMSLKSNDLSLREPIVDFEPILAGLVGYILFPGERKPIFLLAFLLGALIVYWGSHRRKLRRIQKKGLAQLLLATSFYAFLPSIYQYTLAHMSPVYIALIRCLSILVLLSIFLPVRRVTKLSATKIRYSFAAAAFYALGAVVSIYAIKSLGVVLTMVLLMLGPALRYLSSYFILKEKVRAGEVASSAMLSAVVLISVIK